MPKAIRFSIPMISSRESITKSIAKPVIKSNKKSDTKSDAKSESSDLVLLVLSSGVGLLITFILILRGVQAIWN